MPVVVIQFWSGLEVMKKTVITLILVIFPLVIVAGCGKSDSTIVHSADSVFLAYGDSLTAGNGSTDSGDYPAVLERLISRTVINAGVSGETSEQGLGRLPGVVDDSAPDVLILIHGGNDFLQRMDATETRANITAMVELATQKNIQVILVAVPKPGIILSVDSLYDDIAEEFGLPFDSEILKKILSERQFKSDQVHPNNEGYRLLAEAVAALIIN